MEYELSLREKIQDYITGFFFVLFMGALVLLTSVSDGLDLFITESYYSQSE